MLPFSTGKSYLQRSGQSKKIPGSTKTAYFAYPRVTKKKNYNIDILGLYYKTLRIRYLRVMHIFLCKLASSGLDKHTNP